MITDEMKKDLYNILCELKSLKNEDNSIHINNTFIYAPINSNLILVDTNES